MIGEEFNTVFAHLPQSPQGKVLSVFISGTQFQYALLSEDVSQLVGLCDIAIQPAHNPGLWVEQLERLISMHGLNATRFSRSNITVLGNNFTLSPPAFAESGGARALLSFSGGEGRETATTTHHVAGLEFSYSQELELSQSLGRNFRGATIRHAGAVEIELFFSHPSLSSADVFMTVRPGTLSLCVRKAGKFQLYNQYAAHTDEDVLYYLLFACEQFGLQPNRLRLAVSGALYENSPLHRSLGRFAPEVSFCDDLHPLTLAPDMPPIQLARYFTLLNQHLCES